MEPLKFQEIARLISRSRTTEIESKASKSGNGWSLYHGDYRVHGSQYPFQVVYLDAACTKGQVDEAQRAARVGREAADIHLVFAPSLDRRHQRHHELKNNVKGVWDTREYLCSFISDELQQYRDRLLGEEPKYYVRPRVETPSGFFTKRPDPLEYLLLGRDRHDEDTSGILGVLLAEPGQGKTYTTQYLAARLARQDLVPIYINSSQWHSIPVADLESLDKTLTHCFRYYGSSIGWLDGHEDEFVKVTLKAGVFAVVLDGFDEYVLWNKGKINATDVLDALGQLAGSTGARILITSRTSFWESSLSEQERSGAHVFRLVPFDHQNAENYFKMRLTGQGPIRAMTTFKELQKLDEAFTGRGFVLSLIADLAQRSDGLDRPETLHQLLQLLCERESLRQRLPLSADEQIRVLQNLAVEVVQGFRLDTGVVQLALQEVQPALVGKELSDSVEKLKQHPLIRWQQQNDSWTWQEEQIEVMLLADYLCLLTLDDDGAGKLERFCERVRLNPDRRIDIADAVVGVASTQRNMDDEKLADVASGLVRTYLLMGGPCASQEGCALGVAIALRATDKHVPEGMGRRERMRKFEYYCGGESFLGLLITGTIRAMDFGGASFQNCRFEHVVWANCQFDEDTVFEGCHFVGGATLHCQGFGLCNFSESAMDLEAKAWIASAQASDGKRKYSEDDLKSDIKAVLDKFIGRGCGSSS